MRVREADDQLQGAFGGAYLAAGALRNTSNKMRADVRPVQFLDQREQG